VQACDETPRDARPDVGVAQVTWPRQGPRLQQDDRWLTPCLLEASQHAGDASQAIDTTMNDGVCRICSAAAADDILACGALSLVMPEGVLCVNKAVYINEYSSCKIVVCCYKSSSS